MDEKKFFTEYFIYSLYSASIDVQIMLYFYT